ncbi:hypothetical protein F4802DRAFT_516620 [Xylaria palmicola]|nr:hypothetical protein F4802DRAFT_516620 [Xylaria palmicola]
MNFIRANLTGRERGQEDSQLERQRPSNVEEHPQTGLRLFKHARPAVSGLFAGRLGSGARGRQPTEDELETDDGPKSPAPNHSRLSSLTRSRSRGIPIQSPIDVAQGSEIATPLSQSRTRTQRFPVITRPLAVRTAGGETGGHVRRSMFNGSRLAELRLAGRADSTRRRQRENAGGSGRRQHKEPPKRFLFCFPWVKSRRARLLILRCFVSGIFLVSMLTIYLSLSITKNINMSEFSILLILLILLTTIFFCHGLILLCMLLVRPRGRRQSSSENDVEANKFGHQGYAIPSQPIRVVLARDEEAAGIESETTKAKPPAYGLWRESVRVDPNRIYWQRAELRPPSPPTSASSVSNDADHESDRRSAQRRPPSYASDDGIDYVVDARPRSIAPPPSSVYSQTSRMGTPTTSNTPSLPPLPHPAVVAASRPGDWSMA